TSALLCLSSDLTVSAPGYTGSPRSAAVVWSVFTCTPPNGVSTWTFLSSPFEPLSTCTLHPASPAANPRPISKLVASKILLRIIAIALLPCYTPPLADRFLTSRCSGRLNPAYLALLHSRRNFTGPRHAPGSSQTAETPEPPANSLLDRAA